MDLQKICKDVPEGDIITDYIAKNGQAAFDELVLSSKGVVRLSDVSTLQTEWLWNPYIPLGKVTLLTADPGTGKTYFCLYLAAAVSTGRPFFGQSEGLKREPATVIYQTAEDGIADTIKPRLELMNPDFDNIYIIDESQQGLSLSDERVETYMNLLRPSLMIFDPLQAYLGAGVDMHRANEVRPILSKIGHLAEKYRCAIIFIMHNSKMGANKALYRALGSMDIPAIARSMLVMAKNPENEEQKLICHEKSSLAKHGKSILMRIEPEQGGIVFDGFSDLKADDILSPDKDGRNKPSIKRNEVSDKLLEFLFFEHDGAAELTEIKKLQEENGWSQATLYRAKEDLQLKSIVTGFGSGRKTLWLMPNKDSEEFEKSQNVPEQIADNK